MQGDLCVGCVGFRGAARLGKHALCLGNGQPLGGLKGRGVLRSRQSGQGVGRRILREVGGRRRELKPCSVPQKVIEKPSEFSFWVHVETPAV